MRLRLAGLLSLACLTVVATALAGSIPPGRQHRLTIEGENTVTFVPETNLPELKVDYVARIEYIVNSRYGKEPKPAPTSTPATDPAEDESTEKDTVKPTSPSSSKKSKSKAKKTENASSKATGAIDLSLHSSERMFRQNGQPVLEMKVSRTKFQGRVQPEMPVVSLGVNDAPLLLQEIMKNFDVITASLLLNDDLKVVSRKFRNEGPQRAITETILSIHAPVPRNADSWESPTQLVMGQGQTAKGMLRFEKDKARIAATKDKDKESPLVKVKVSGVLRAEGVIAGRLIKDGTYTVTGEQTFDMKTHEWTASQWSVAIDNQLANANGQIIARAKGKMTVQSKALDGPSVGPNTTEGTVPKL